MGLPKDDGLPYEQLRQARLAENRMRMEALGLVTLSNSLCNSARSNKINSSSKLDKKCIPSPHPAGPPVATRRSSRLLGTTLPSFKEVSTVKDSESRIAVEDYRNRLPEVYTEEDEKLLGHYDEDWELFKDGYGADGARIYDPISGKTCHQCRQKTLGHRTWCSQCESLRGQFCGDCLFMRYGENVLETKNEKWVCPGCRGICNCSCCRIKKGWAPTGSMYRLALSQNFKSVAHYLIFTRRGSEGNQQVQKSSGNAHLQRTTTSTAEGSTANAVESEQPEGLVRRPLICPASPNAKPSEEELMLDVSDTKRDERKQSYNGKDTIGSRLRKKPRRCKMNSKP